MSLLIGFAAFVAALIIGYCVLVARLARQKPQTDREFIRSQIVRAERRHLPRRHLRKQLVESVRQELERA